MSLNVLVVTPYMPFPTRNNGLSVRLAPVIEELAKSHRVHLLVVGDQWAAEGEGIEVARAVCASVSVLYPPRPGVPTRVGLLKALLGRPRPPHHLFYSLHREALRRVRYLATKHACTRVLVLGDLLSHVAVKSKASLPHILHALDWVDSPSLHAERLQLSLGHTSGLVRDIKEWERQVNSQLDSAIYISTSDASFANPKSAGNIAVIPNGLVDDFPRSRESSWRTSFGDVPVVTIGFLGNMGYGPNDEAARRLCVEIAPQIRQQLPDLEIKVKIIGKSPTDALLEVRSETVHVTGFVEDIWPPAEDVDVFVFPMRTGAGMQNKVLEAMRCRRPVIASSVCWGGIPNADSSHVFRADSASEVGRIIRELSDQPKLVEDVVSNGLAYLEGLSSQRMVQLYLRQIEIDTPHW